jgi:Trypsin-co-occurring domain 1
VTAVSVAESLWCRGHFSAAWPVWCCGHMIKTGLPFPVGNPVGMWLPITRGWLGWREDGMTSKVVEVVLPNKTVALVRAVELDEGGGGGAEKVAWKDAFDFEHVSGTLEGVAQAIRSGLEKVRPTRTSVELGIELAVKNGKLTGMLVEGAANASLRVTLEWDSDQPGDSSDRG